MRRSTFNGRALVFAAVLGGAVLGTGAAPAAAGVVAVKPTPHATEASQASILAHRYGGSFAVSGDGLTNGTVTAVRLDDGLAGVWTGGTYTATVLARFAQSGQSLGYFTGPAGGSFTAVVDAGAFGYDAAGTSATMDMNGGTWRWGRGGGVGPALSSLAADNGGEFQLAAYQITGLGAAAPDTYVLFWEDVSDGTSDRDYNDLVVELRGTGLGPAAAVPLPAAFVPALATLAGGGLIARWRKARRGA